MGSLLFSPSGRIGPSAYMRGMLIIGAIAAALNLVLLVSPALGMILGIIGLVFYVCLIMMGIKRSHDAGKSGWMSVTHLLLFFGVSAALGLLLNAIGMGVSEADEAALQAAGETGDLGAVMELTGQIAQATAIPSAITTFLAFAITAFLVNMFNKQDMGDNQYGPVPVA